MKKLITLLLTSALLLSSAPAMARGVATPSLSSLRIGDNPAILGFDQKGYAIGFTTKNTQTIGGSNEITEYNLQGVYEDFFFALNGESTMGYNEDSLSLGWAWESVSLGAYHVTSEGGGFTDTGSGFGFVWKYEDFYLGGMKDKFSWGGGGEFIALSYYLEGSLRLEVGNLSDDDGLGVISTVNSTELEIQLGNAIFGMRAKNATNGKRTVYLAWEPTDGGFAFALEHFAKASPIFISGSVLRVGYNF